MVQSGATYSRVPWNNEAELRAAVAIQPTVIYFMVSWAICSVCSQPCCCQSRRRSRSPAKRLLRHVAVQVADDFYGYGGGVYQSTMCTTSINHAMVAVGYATGTPEGDYWIVQVRPHSHVHAAACLHVHSHVRSPSPHILPAELLEPLVG